MHRLFQRRVGPETWMGVMTIWILAPNLPLIAGTLAKAGLAPVALQRDLVEWTSLALVPVLWALSLWGAAEIRARLKATPMKGWDLVGPPIHGIVLVGVASIAARWLSNQLSDDWGGPFSFYGVLVLAWAALVAQQLKYFWEHALDAWETRRGDFMPNVRRFNWFARRLARRALADRQARVWNARRREGLDAAERVAFRGWRRNPIKQGGLRRQGFGTPRWVYWSVTLAIAATTASYAWHTILARP